jgi:hypothetical protein
MSNWWTIMIAKLQPLYCCFPFVHFLNHILLVSRQAIQCVYNVEIVEKSDGYVSFSGGQGLVKPEEITHLATTN